MIRMKTREAYLRSLSQVYQHVPTLIPKFNVFVREIFHVFNASRVRSTHPVITTIPRVVRTHNLRVIGLIYSGANGQSRNTAKIFRIYVSVIATRTI